MMRFQYEETVTDYLTKLDELTSNKSNITSFLRDASHELHFRYIEPEMPKWNPNLMYSPLEPRHNVVDIGGGKDSIRLIYTGFTEAAEERDLPKGVWSEFGDKVQGILHRDYAFYQETGEDPIAPDFEGHWYVKKGTANYANEFHYKTMAYLDRLMHLEGWNRTSQHIDLDDYIGYF